MSENWTTKAVKELRSECEARGIRNHGNKGELVKRLEDYEKVEEEAMVEMPPTPPSTIKDHCDAVLVTRADLGEDDEMIEAAKTAFRNVLENEQLVIDYDMVPITIGNHVGLGLASLPGRMKVLESKIVTLEAKNTTLEAKNASLTSDVASHASQIDSLQSQVGDLTLSLEAYTILRHRFICTFKRDKFGGYTDDDKIFIGDGNDTAHGGDAIADARLYTGSKPRRDYTAYKKLYGFPPQVVREFIHAETISVLNTHASVCASKRETGTAKFYHLFAEFVRLFEEASYDPGYLVGDPTPLSGAYSSFVSCRKSEVKRTKRVS
ncbi:hypothetical protein HOY82DRAFT_540281 [Tuber indicum]|nr:hypothetical protein HOY82DRAFT_540281 [Tuber indicum]